MISHESLHQTCFELYNTHMAFLHEVVKDQCIRCAYIKQIKNNLSHHQFCPIIVELQWSLRISAKSTPPMYRLYSLMLWGRLIVISPSFNLRVHLSWLTLSVSLEIQYTIWNMTRLLWVLHRTKESLLQAQLCY